MIKKRTQKAVSNAVFQGSLRKMNTEIKNNFLHSYKVKHKWKKECNKQIVKACQSILQRINNTHGMVTPLKP